MFPIRTKRQCNALDTIEIEYIVLKIAINCKLLFENCKVHVIGSPIVFEFKSDLSANTSMASKTILFIKIDNASRFSATIISINALNACDNSGANVKLWQ